MSLAARPLATVSANAVPRRARLSAEAAASEIGVQRSRENSRVNPGSNCAPQKPAHEVIAALVDMKQWNPSWVCPRIAQQIDPFVERLIGTIRRECRDDTLFCTAADLETKLLDFQSLLQRSSHIRGAGRRTSESRTDTGGVRASVNSYRWQPHCRGVSDPEGGVTHVGRLQVRAKSQEREFFQGVCSTIGNSPATGRWPQVQSAQCSPK